ncbi:4-hydroxy-2-oxo-heptane-1,7-dioate aldolase [Pseudomonas sp. AD21]|uniref:4-hydroxy-2-oxoheptanedioate aldolase n=1 Tax=Pseudomonas sp. AD21 TaxID=396378 RepID=UPI000C82FCDD|nr:4-hydroxy-2-oxoheptanedioate aldolase [Pseudomonas sp. AD21]PMQ11570.1 4-hydroxy-2-oxo-heptane-1,7-dioate aldolase [Pseudomonas sp. AD21]
MLSNKNHFKQALREGRRQIGLWVGLGSSYSTEIVATAGFDWLLIDGEHAPNDVRSVLTQLQAAAPYPSHPVVRPVEANKALIKQYLEIGAQTLLVPMIDTAEEAASAVSATRYPPQGVRGVGSSLARSSRWNGISDYLHKANEEICVLVQVETATALNNLVEILNTDGVDGVFFGPADLAASMGYLGNASAPEVQRALLEGIATVQSHGKAAGILTSDVAQAKRYLENGALFVAVGVDATLLAQSSRALALEFSECPQLASAYTKGDGTY